MGELQRSGTRGDGCRGAAEAEADFTLPLFVDRTQAVYEGLTGA